MTHNDIDGLCRLALVIILILLIVWKAEAVLEAPIGAVIVTTSIIYICGLGILATRDTP